MIIIYLFSFKLLFTCHKYLNLTRIRLLGSAKIRPNALIVFSETFVLGFICERNTMQSIGHCGWRYRAISFNLRPVATTLSFIWIFEDSNIAMFI